MEDKDIGWNDLIALACGEADAETAEKVRAALGDPKHPVSYLTQRTSGTKISSTPQDADVRSLIDGAIAPYISGARPLADLENRSIVDEVCRKLEQKIHQHTLISVASALETALNDFLGDGTHAANLTDTVSAGLETTFVSSAANPEMARKRHQAINTFEDVNSLQCGTYLLYEFAGRSTDEIAELQGLTAQEVTQRLAVARVEIEVLMEG